MRIAEYMVRRAMVWSQIRRQVRAVIARDGVPVTPVQQAAFAQNLVFPVRRARQESATLAAHVYNGEAARIGGFEPIGKPTPAFYPPEAIVSVVERATAPKVTIEGLDKVGAEHTGFVQIEGLDDVGTVLEQARVEIDDTNRRDPQVVEQVTQRVERAVTRHVEQAGRDAIKTAVEAEQKRAQTQTAIGWARVLTGAESCGWCAMLASRGPVYKTRESASHVVGQARSAMAAFNGTPARTRGPRSLGDKFHDGCDCLIVPVFDLGDWIGIDAYDALEELWIDSDGRKDFERRFRKIRKDGDITPYVGAVDPAA